MHARTLSLLAILISPGLLALHATGLPGPTADPLACAAAGVTWEGGCVSWTSTHLDASGSFGASGLAVHPIAPLLYVVGYVSDGTTGADAVTLALDAVTGREVWTARHDGPGHARDLAREVALSADGTRLFVSVTSADARGAKNAEVLAYDAHVGTLAWSARSAGDMGAHELVLLAASPTANRVFVAASLRDPAAATYDFNVTAYDGATGAPLWTSAYAGPGSSSDEIRDIRLSPDGSRVFVSGSDGKYRTVAYDAETGAELWVARWGAAGFHRVFAMDVPPTGERVFVTGHTWAGTGTDIMTVAYDAASGAELWAARYDGPTGTWDIGYSIVASPDGRAVVISGLTGLVSYSHLATGANVATVAYDAATGGKLWASVYDGPGRGADYASTNTLAASPCGDRYYVGATSLGTAAKPDYAILAYDAATGAQEEVARYATGTAATTGPFALDGSGAKAFMSGRFFGPGGGIGTIAVETGIAQAIRSFPGPDAPAPLACANVATL